mmetsp:Transcript_86926/g.153702  ORF Transcript_86926/g.153702 Transcript_86926/m.153702 type:complete len:335 (-) Transcript_86926:40-1044(-)|eukprot:CAMPEP_0197653652 /NCGR_PEP_ID=MMETSP1338-20131121/36556_1 /TAXON_ID=43686 ORGANISM="Pelagodinium beii, Strain RCC1491" /NCGR_SAMPLE_ID=MMETSP1338 /ASSEMBLY_ACC=CAM_ASM_000754 /LENGTH=334 /DNA_ID=CAMNT_0043228849 /DNA_START=47 /DNA_END=1051 /DNA_ORIENTATION=-
MPEAGPMDLRRKFQIANAKPKDHAGDIIVVRSPSFELDNTIFKHLDSTIARLAQKDRLGIEVFWSDAAATSIHEAFQRVPRPPPLDKELVDFMENECNFSMEHADGSFMDHLIFCYEYSAAHFPGHTPNVLLLHSIMGVGTNVFPMEKSKIPKLQSLITEEEFTHVQAFPSVLRLILSGRVLPELQDRAEAGEKLAETFESLSCHRVIDNEKISLEKEDFWIHLNYQLIHLLDFLPVSGWSERMDDTFLEPFLMLHQLLVTSGKLMAKVDLELKEGTQLPDGIPNSLIGFLMKRVVPSSIKRRIAQKSLERFSAEIGHSLSYELAWCGPVASKL